MTPAQDPFAAYQPSDEPDQPTAQEKSSTNRKVAILVGGTTLVGASLAGLAWGMSRANPEETSVSASQTDDDLRIDKEGAIRTIADSANTASGEQTPTASLLETDISTAGVSAENISTHSHGSDSGASGASGQGFSDAFRSARDEMGAGKFFTWHGNLYSTNFKEEWEAKPEADQKTYFSGIGLAEADINSTLVEPPPIQDDTLPEETPHPVGQALIDETAVADGIPVSIEELKNAEYSSDKITIVDAVTVQEDGDNMPIAIESTNDQSDADEWIHHEPGQFTDQTDSEMDSFSMPHYSSSMTDDLSDDDDQDTD